MTSAERKAKRREEMRRVLDEVGTTGWLKRRRKIAREHPRQHTCFSATCDVCGRVWLSAIRPIRPNAWDGRRRVYRCREHLEG